MQSVNQTPCAKDPLFQGLLLFSHYFQKFSEYYFESLMEVNTLLIVRLDNVEEYNLKHFRREKRNNLLFVEIAFVVKILICKFLLSVTYSWIRCIF